MTSFEVPPKHYKQYIVKQYKQQQGNVVVCFKKLFNINMSLV